ncbi:E3 ubiquitin-protein ligase ZNF598 [Sergentomyia squamirostris]
MSSSVKKIGGDEKENYENSCVVCFIEVSIFSVGICDHAVCYVCSTRMRVLCSQNECPICRQELSKVIFSYEKHPFRQLEVTTRSGLYDKKYRIVFGDLVIQNSFYKLLEHSCPRCDCQPFISFEMLRKHVQREHELFYCELCTENLRIFTFERRCYTREELGKHKRKGDPDNTSHRGHPICEYCDVRFLDRDELFRHLRREHFFCHFCDADGSNLFYSDYSSLRVHFSNEHYLCEEGDCIEEQFTAVFRTDIDLRAHKASMHSKSMGKYATKQTRTLEVEFFLAPRNRQGVAAMHQDVERSTQYRPLMGSTEINQQPPKMINANDEQEFPALGGSGSNPPVPVMRPSVSIKTKSYGGSGLAKTKENFPALGGGVAPVNMPSSSADASSTKQYSKMVQKPPQPPPQPASPPSTSKSTVIHISNRPPPPKHPDVTRDFPALPKSTKIIDQPTPVITVNPKTVASKYRGIVEDSTLILPNNSLASKLMMVNRPQTVTNGATKKAVEAKEPKVPKLNSEHNFPTLNTAASALTTPPSWVTLPVNKNKVESRKSKIAPAPDLSHQQHTPTTNNSAIKSDEKNGQKKKNKAKTKEKEVEVKSKSTNGKNPPKEHNNNNIVNGIGALKISKGTDDASMVNQASLPPPPGFDNLLAGKGKNNKQPPPGFNSVTLNSVSRKPNNNLTFTNSTGESYSIMPTKKYIPPPESKKRNEVLLGHFMDALKTREAVKEFHNISQMFLNNQYNAQPYYEHCLAALGDKFSIVFPEFLALMPDIGKQQELYLVHAQREKSLSKKGGSQRNDTIIDVCSLCKQVLLREDLFAHLQTHKLESNFPVLGK